jgi:hypothetical protein
MVFQASSPHQSSANSYQKESYSDVCNGHQQGAEPAHRGDAQRQAVNSQTLIRGLRATPDREAVTATLPFSISLTPCAFLGVRF